MYMYGAQVSAQWLFSWRAVDYSSLWWIIILRSWSRQSLGVIRSTRSIQFSVWGEWWYMYVPEIFSTKSMMMGMQISLIDRRYMYTHCRAYSHFYRHARKMRRKRAACLYLYCFWKRFTEMNRQSYMYIVSLHSGNKKREKRGRKERYNVWLYKVPADVFSSAQLWMRRLASQLWTSEFLRERTPELLFASIKDR